MDTVLLYQRLRSRNARRRSDRALLRHTAFISLLLRTRGVLAGFEDRSGARCQDVGVLHETVNCSIKLDVGFELRSEAERAHGSVSHIRQGAVGCSIGSGVTHRCGFHLIRMTPNTTNKSPEPTAVDACSSAVAVHLFDALSDMVDSKAIGQWLKAPNPAFDGSTPLQVIERGETDRIWRMIWELQTGNAG